MIFYPELCLALRCPECQDTVLYRSISLFSLKNEEERTIRCSCGAEIMKFRLSGKKHLYIDVACPICREMHHYIHNIKELSGDMPLILTCEELGLQLAYLGTRETVCRAMHDDHLEILAHEAELQPLFYNPKAAAKGLIVMNQHFLNNSIHCLSCGGQNHDPKGFDFEMNGSQLLIRCSACKTKMTLVCSRLSDMVLPAHAEKIHLHRGGSRLIFGGRKQQ